MQYRVTLESNTDYGKLVIPEIDEPIGLNDLTLYIRRDDQFHGIFPQVSTKLKFICSGRDYIKGVYDSYGIGIDISVRIDFQCNESNQWEMLFVGKIDLTEVEFTYQFAEAPIKPTNCLDLFMERLDTQVNLYDEPCFTELTYDGTAVRTRYEFCPYFMLFKSKKILSVCKAALKPNDGDLYKNQKEWEVNCGLFGSVVYSDANIPANVIAGTCPNSTINKDYDALVMCVQFPINVDIDDIGLFNEFYTPGNNEVVVTKDCSDNPNTYTKPQCTPEDYIGTAKCTCTVDAPISYTITLDLSVDFYATAIWLTNQTDLEAFGVSSELILEWGAVSIVLDSIPTDWVQPPSLSGCNYNNNFNPVVGNVNNLSYNGVITTNPCDVNINDKLRIFVKHKGSVAVSPASPIQSVDITLRVNTDWSKADVTITSSCVPELVNIGDSRERVFAVHESFSRLVEHYTNNCLRVKSCYFGRPNSMAGANIYEYQNPTCDPPLTEIAEVFDPTPFQTGNLPTNICEDAGCGAWTVITSGIILRAFGRSMFTSFNEMYEAMDCVFNIGVGYLDSEPDTIRIENKEYFYQNQQVLSFNLDEYNSKLVRKPAIEYMAKKFLTGYMNTIKDELNTCDEFNTSREYTFLNTKVDNELTKQTEWVASGYTIEWQRRSRYSVDAQFDDNKFIIATERFVGTPFPADGMYYPELGVDNPSSTLPTPPTYAPLGLIDPDTVYNWRLSPYYNAVRWASYLRMSTWKQSDELLKFSKGETNYNVAGNEPGIHYGCDIDIDYDLPPTTELTHREDSDIHLQDITFERATKPLFKPETVSFEHAISFTEFLMIKQNPYGIITVNGDDFYIKEIAFRLNKSSKFTLLKA